MTRERLEEIGAPGRIIECVLSPGFEPTWPLLAMARRAWSDRETLIVIAGPTQVRKSTTAAVLACGAAGPGRKVTAMLPCDADAPGAYLVDGVYFRDVACEVGGRPLRAHWVNAPDALEHLFDEAFWRPFDSAELVVLDDWGLGPQTENIKSQLIAKVVGRYNENRRTIVTTNFDQAQFRSMYCTGGGERLAARLGAGWIQAGGTPQKHDHHWSETRER